MNIGAKYISIHIVSILLLVGCGGGGGSSDDSQNDPEQPQDNNANAGLSGYFFPEESSRGNGTYIIDASSGKGTPVSNTTWSQQTDIFPNGDFYQTPVDYDHNYFLVSSRGCRYYSLAVDISCIAVQDFNGNYVSNFSLFYDVYTVRMSPDKAHVALFRNTNPGSTNGEYLEIYNLNGDLLSDLLLKERSFQWHPTEGRIVYPVNNRQLQFTEPYSTVGSYYLTLPDSGIDGSIYDFSISPDGTKIVLIMSHNTTQFSSVQANAYIMNINGTDIRLLADVPEDEEGYITDPTWSPDGKWIMLKEGYAAGQDSNTPGTSGYLYIVPSQDQGKTYTLSIQPSQRSSEVKLLKRDIDPLDEDDNRLIESAITGVTLRWIP